ncbi:hypothetical protein BS78_04G080000 [Paspalum vaginatum]|nr:hypothetical protein BS78_04G080000 [Paspalum vaginatum]
MQTCPKEKKEEKRTKARASYHRRKGIKHCSVLSNQKTAFSKDSFLAGTSEDEMTRVAQTNNMAGDEIDHDDWLHRNDLYVRLLAERSKISTDETNGVFLMMSSAVFISSIKNTPYNALKRGKNREWYSQLSADAKHNKITRSMEMRARRNSTRQETGCDTTPQSALTHRASRPSTRMASGGLRGDQNLFDSGLWEPDDPMHGVEVFTENDLDNQDLDDGDGDMYEDDEAKAFNERGNVCMKISILEHSTNKWVPRNSVLPHHL